MYNNKTIACIIPARMSSSRIPGKPLAKIKGREMFLRVADIAKQSQAFQKTKLTTFIRRLLTLLSVLHLVPF